MVPTTCRRSPKKRSPRSRQVARHLLVGDAGHVPVRFARLDGAPRDVVDLERR
jgi:hypothetical protein